MSELAEELVRPYLRLETDCDLAALVALSGLPGLTPSRLWSLIALGTPSEIWHRVCAGKAPRSGRAKDPADSWHEWAITIEPRAQLDLHRRHGVAILPFGATGYPEALLEDPDPPAVLFRQGPATLDQRCRVAVVGTRRCTRYGSDVARELGAALAGRGVDVVSGLASGIDAAAHAGAQSANPERLIGVVAGGVDAVYPPRNAGLFKTVATSGALLSEWPLRSSPRPWKFPARNRLVAALSAAVVVVESAQRGGSMYTVDEALRRDRAVFAVPGSIRSPVSAGTNQLIADGAFALSHIDQFLDQVAPSSGSQTSQVELVISSWLLDVIGWEPMALDAVVFESGRSLGEVTLEVEKLIGVGAIRRLGGVIERVT